MKDYIKPSISALHGGIERIDLQSGTIEEPTPDYALFWGGHDGGSYSVVKVIVTNREHVDSISGTITYKGVGEIKYYGGIADNYPITVLPNGKNSYTFTVSGLGINNKTDNKEFTIGTFQFYETDGITLRKHEGYSDGAFTTGDGDSASTVDQASASNANIAFDVTLK